MVQESLNHRIQQAIASKQAVEASAVKFTVQFASRFCLVSFCCKVVSGRPCAVEHSIPLRVRSVEDSISTGCFSKCQGNFQ